MCGSVLLVLLHPPEMIVNEKLFVPVTAGLHALANLVSVNYAGKNNFEVADRKSVARFVLVPASQPVKTHVHYTIALKKILSKLHCLEEASISAHFVFVGNGYIQDRACEWSEKHGLHYSMHLIQVVCTLADTVIRTYEAHLAGSEKIGANTEKRNELSVSGTKRRPNLTNSGEKMRAMSEEAQNL